MNLFLPMKRCVCRRIRAKQGFALVVTLTLMALLMVIVVGLFTLSSISLRSSSQSIEMAAARANARMALSLAIDKLQKYTGPDTRITARADVLKADNPPILGVWRSWEGEDHAQNGSAPGRPISPGDYQTKKQKHFLTWLVSGGSSNIDDVPDTTSGSNKVTLLGENSVGSGAAREKLQIHLSPDIITNGDKKGACAWWISGENQKARLPKPYKPAQENAGSWAANMKSHSIADTKPFQMDSLLTDADPAEKAITLKESDLIAKESDLRASQEFYHDLSATSIGLLTNVATGGWKKDFSLLTENWGKVGTSRLPFFRLKPGEDILCSLPTSNSPTAPKSMLYPWSSYRGSPSDIVIYQQGAVASWENLKDYILTYRNSPSDGNRTMTAVATAIDVSSAGDCFNFLHKVRVLPVIARIQWVYSHFSARAGGSGTSTVYTPYLLLTPVITMWNPYNVSLSYNQTPMVFKIEKPLPTAMKYTINGSTDGIYKSLITGSTNYTNTISNFNTLDYQINTAFTLKPGETRVFSPASSTVVTSQGSPVVLAPGYRSKGGHGFALKTASGANTAPGGATMKAEVAMDTVYNDSITSTPSQGVGIYLNMYYQDHPRLAYRMVYTPQVAKEIYKPVTGLATSPPLSSLTSTPVPFMTTIFGARMASKTLIPSKGFVQSSPFVNYTAMGGKDQSEPNIGRHYGGTSHPVNSPFDYSFEKLAGAGDSLLPNESDTSGYIVTGFTKADGLSRCVISELPTRPLTSLAELQNWDMRYENPIPPYAFNIIGNSDANPLLPANAVVNSADAGLSTNLQHDDSYCANHLLFDDWFFSSINPDPANFGKGNIQTTYTDFVTGTEPLANHAYKPIDEDEKLAANSSSSARTLYDKYANKNDSWKTIASRLEVEGMFNVNSTSVTAWRALLGHARNQKIPFIRDNGTGWSIDLSRQSDYAFSRFSVAGDVESKQRGSSGAFPESAEFAGYRVLDERTLDALAEEIVKQVRLRGPFLSLAEFVNRQLSSGDLALAGAIQTALNHISKSTATNPYAGITNVISRVASASPPASSSAEYKFPDAAVGEVTYGLPGWTRQADVLRPLAPILTARDDTFTIRAYGDSRGKDGKITASAVCEAVVRRTREYVDPNDKAEITTLPSSKINQRFGRRYEIVSFRWVSRAEL
jgi:hypothetical protein